MTQIVSPSVIQDIGLHPAAYRVEIDFDFSHLNYNIISWSEDKSEVIIDVLEDQATIDTILANPKYTLKEL